MKQTDFTVENQLPLPAVFFLIIVSTKKIFKELWALGIILLVKEWKNQPALIFQLFIALAVILGLAIIRGVLLYRSFKYVVKDEEFIVKKGILKKTILNIPLHRIQNISITQGFWQQLVNITTLSVDTAGSAGKEVEVYLDETTSNALKEFLNKSRNNLGDDLQIDADTECFDVQIEKTDEKISYIYSTPQLIVSAISRNHLKGFGLFVAVVFSTLSQAGDWVVRKFLSTIEPIVSESHTFVSWIVFVLFGFLLVVLVNTVHTCLKYYDLSVKLYSDRIKYHGGLTHKMEQIISLDKIQIIRESSNLLEKALNVSTLNFLQYLSIGDKSKNKITAIMPGFWNSKELTQRIYNGLETEKFLEFYPERNYLFRNFYIYALYPSLIIALGAFIKFEILFAALLWLVVVGICAGLRYKKSKSEIGNEYIRISSGMVGEIVSTIKIKNVQSVTFKQSVFQERKKTASVIISTRWDNMVIPFVNEEKAREICNYLLYKVEC